MSRPIDADALKEALKAETWWATDKRDPLGCAGMKFCGNCGADMRGGQDG